MTGCTLRRYGQLEAFPETIEQELRPAVCEHRQTDRLKENYSIDKPTCYYCMVTIAAGRLRLDSSVLISFIDVSVSFDIPTI